MNISDIKDIPHPTKETAMRMIIFLEDNKTTEEKNSKMDTKHNQNEKESFRPQNPTIQDQLKEICNDRKREANTTSPVPNQSPEKKMILPSQPTAIQIETHHETDV